MALLTDGLGRSGGIARYNSDLVEAWSGSRFVDSVTIVPRFGIRIDSMPKVHQTSGCENKLWWAFRVLVLAATRRYDVIFCGHINVAPVAFLAAKLSGAKFWLQLHGIEAWQSRGYLVDSASCKSDLVTAVSRYTRHRFLAWCNTKPQLIRVLPNTFAPSFGRRPRRPDLIERHGLQGKKVILTVGRLSKSERYKGHDRVIQSLPSILSEIPDVCYLVVGSGDDIERLRYIASSLSVSERVVFAGQVNEEDLADYFSVADVFAMPSTGEGFGIVFLEAAATGLPVIGSKQGGCPDALADGQIGFLAEPEDATSLSNIIVRCLKEGIRTAPELTSRFQKANFQHHVDCLLHALD